MFESREKVIQFSAVDVDVGKIRLSCENFTVKNIEHAVTIICSVR